MSSCSQELGMRLRMLFECLSVPCVLMDQLFWAVWVVFSCQLTF